MDKHFDRNDYKRGFWAFMGVQFQGAASDNIFRYFIVYLLISSGATGVFAYLGPVFGWEMDPEYDVTATGTMLFALPYILFPGLFGALADRFAKQRIVMSTKLLEVAVMALGGIGLLTGNVLLIWATLFMMAAQSAMFGPAKYGILPEMLPEGRLAWGNGMIQMGTMAAIIVGQGIAGPLFNFLYPAPEAVDGSAGTWYGSWLAWTSSAEPAYLVSILLMGLALVGVGFARYVSDPPAANPHKQISLNPYEGMWGHFKVMAADRWLLLTVAGYVYFWFIAALLQANVIPFAKVELGLNETWTSIMLGVVAIGIGAGAMAAGYLSRGKVEVGLIPLGAVGMSAFCALLFFDIPSVTLNFLMIFGLGFMAGIFDVPLAATLQHRSPAHVRGGIMATTNMLTFAGIFSAGALLGALNIIGLESRGIFLIAAIMTFAMGTYVCFILPVFLIRFALWVLANTLYRLRVIGRTNIPEQGGGLLIANHTSFLDALIIIASIDRQVRFVMHQGVYEVPWIKPLAKMVGAIPITPGGGPREVVQSLRFATEALKKGELVCIFAEGQITRTGQMLPFRKGFERIMQDVDVPIIPVHIDQIWGSIFSFSESKFFLKWPKQIPFPITISYGTPLPSSANAYDVRSAIQELGSEAYSARHTDFDLLHRQFIRKARRSPLSKDIYDTRSGELSNLRALAGMVILATKLKRVLGPEEMVGILLPQGTGGVLANTALTLMGRVPVNMNYTSSNEALQAAAKRCGMRHVITAHAFLQNFPVDVPGEPIFVEDIMATVTGKDRIIGMLKGMFMPIRWLEKSVDLGKQRSTQDLATVVFSSGSEGEAKGIMLTHFNIASNVESALQVFPYEKNDCIVGMLPFFHSFGYTVTLWIPLTRPFKVCYHANPLETKTIGKMISDRKATIMFSTSTFLQGFIRRCSATQLSSLRIVVTGAEKLAPRVRDAFKEKFGIEPLEGYGTTECSPIVSLNVPDFRAPGFYQRGNKRGSIGHPLPGISVRIIDPETREILQNGEAGLLCVKGPNVMTGYLGMQEKTESVLKDGWYETGDISVIDEDGFITITDRLARFSKLGGEMVSHTKVEDALQKLVDTEERVLAVASVTDETKGERLIVLHTLNDEQFEDLISRLDETGLPNLWIPKRNAFYQVDEIPILGTGKMDISGVKKLARQLDIGE